MATETWTNSNLKYGDVVQLVWREGLPFLTLGAVDYIERVISPSSRVFEWGAGGSTLWFARRAASVVSVEHQQTWHEKVAKRLGEEGIGNVDLRFVSHEPYEPYVNIVSEFPSGHFRLVLVDGRQRVRCIQRAMSRVEPGGILVLDNSDRSWYACGIELLVDWEKLDFPEPWWVTTVFVKPENDHG